MEKYHKLQIMLKGRMTDYFTDTVNECTGGIPATIYQEDFYDQSQSLCAEFKMMEAKNRQPVLTYTIAIICLDGL